jgi:hypothetical protein
MVDQKLNISPYPGSPSGGLSSLEKMKFKRLQDNLMGAYFDAQSKMDHTEGSGNQIM